MSYKERHHKVKPCITCEAWSEDQRACYIIRLAITPNEKNSYISENVVNEETGNWAHFDDSTCTVRLRPGRWDIVNKRALLYPINFIKRKKEEFNCIEKRGLPNHLKKTIVNDFRVADCELLEDGDVNLPVHGSIGLKDLKLLEDMKIGQINPGLRIHSTVFGDYVFGSSHTIRLPQSEVDRKRSEWDTNQRYINMTFAFTHGDHEPVPD